MKKIRIKEYWEYELQYQVANNNLEKFIKRLMKEEYKKGYIDGSRDKTVYYEKELDNIYGN